MAAETMTLKPDLRSSFMAGLGTPSVMLMMLAMIILPLPAFALDILFTVSIAQNRPAKRAQAPAQSVQRL